MKSGGRRPPVAVNGAGDRTPTGIALGAGAVSVVTAAMLAALAPAADAGWRFGLVAGAVGLFAAVTGDGWAVAAVVPLGFLIVNGFLVDRAGELAWHGSPDLLRLMLLILIGGSGIALGEAARGLRELRTRWRTGAYLAVLVEAMDEKERRDA
jgi:MFS family permease